MGTGSPASSPPLLRGEPPPQGPLPGSLLAYFALAYAFSWPFFIAAARQTELTPTTVFATLGAIMPSLAAILVTARAAGGPGVRDLLRPIARAEVAARFTLFALVYLVSIKLAAALLVRFVTGAWPRLIAPQELIVIPFAIAISTPVQAGEEIGWRGFALPRLARRIGLRWASLALGPIWAFWHLPLFYAATADSYHQSIWVYTLTVTAISVAMAWLYAGSGSLLLVMLMHAAVNNTKDIVPSAGPHGTSPFGLNATPVGWASLALLWVGALVLLARMPKAIARPSTSRD